MRTIIVEDDIVMLYSLAKYCKIPGVKVIDCFQSSKDAELNLDKLDIDLAILDIEMPQLSGLELAKKLRAINEDVLIVFVTAHSEYIQEANHLNADYYIIKPFKISTIEHMMTQMMILCNKKKKPIYMQMFGVFTVFKDGKPVPLVGKAKEILAMIASKRGREVSNEEIYATIWENRLYSNEQMKVYYNALSRLRKALEKEKLSELIISTRRGQLLNIGMVECDYYSWLKGERDGESRFEGEFLSEYSWAESVLGNIMNDDDW